MSLPPSITGGRHATWMLKASLGTALTSVGLDGALTLVGMALTILLGSEDPAALTARTANEYEKSFCRFATVKDSLPF